MFFFDIKMLAVHMTGYFIFLFIGHILHPEKVLPIHIMIHDEEYLYHIIVMAITLICLLFITYFVRHFLLQAQIDEEENQFLLERQLEYYQHTDFMDRELRKFRHDIKNHFVVMQNLLSDNKLDECLSYFQTLKEDFSFQEKLYFSGNIIVDSILNYNLIHYCCTNAKITVYGSLPEINQISSIDLCILFSNMLSNAITAVNDSQLEEPELSIHFKAGQQFFSITVSNSFTPSDLETSLLKKMDRNHGFGIDKIKAIVSRYQAEREVEIETSYFALPSRLYSDMKEQPFDLVFMDLEFENKLEDGILWSQKIHQDFPQTLILILTGYPQRYKEGYIVRAFRFMTKPVIEKELYEYMDDCLNELQIAQQVSFFRRGMIHKIFLKDIFYFQAQSGGSELFTYDVSYYCDESLLQWENTLPPHIFFRCHKKYLVNLGHIASLKNHTITLKNGVKLSVSRRKWTALLSAYMKFDVHTKQNF